MKNEDMRIRMVVTVATKYGYYPAGHTVFVPDSTARAWIAARLAEEDKSLDGAPETK